MIVLLDAAPHPELVDEGVAREMINRIQRLRKKAGLVPTDDVHMRYRVLADPDKIGLDRLVASQQDMFVAAPRGWPEKAQENPNDGSLILEEEHSVGSLVLKLQLARLE